MSEFEAKKLNVANINSGQKYQNGDGLQAKSFNELVEATLQNSNDIDFIDMILEGSNIYAELELSEAYTSRVTANGANIFDGQLTPVESINGSTVKSKNLFDISKIPTTNPNSNLVNNGNGTLTVPPSIYSATTGLPFKSMAHSLKVGDIVTFSMKTNGNNFIYIAGYKTVKNNATFTVTQEVLDGQLIFYGTGNLSNSSEECTISDIQIEYGETATAYQPYFTGLKNANINSIVSKNTQGETIATYQLPQTVELGEFDTLYPEKGTIERFTKLIDFTNEYTWSVPTEGLIQYNNILYPSPDLSQPLGQGICNLFEHATEPSDKDMTWYFQGGILYFAKKGITNINEWTAYLSTQASNGNPLMLAYKTAETNVVEPFNAPQAYEVDKGGTETVVQGETDNSEYGALPTITQTYIVKVGS